MLVVKNNIREEIKLEDIEGIVKEIGAPEIVLKRRFRKKALRYYNIECGFDIETTSTYIDGQKAAWMYEWTFGIKDTIIIGRTWHEYLVLLEVLQSVYSEAIWVVYVHNLSFEFQFMQGYIPFEDVFASEARTVLYARANNLEFRDSYILSGYSLSKVAENLISHDIKKLYGDLDYSLIRTSDTELSYDELSYCINDVLIILYYINEQIQEFGNITKIPMTNTGRVRGYCRDKCLTLLNSKGKKVRNHDYMDLMRAQTMTPDLYKMSRLAFRGGFTHSSIINNMTTLEHVGSYDLTSAYPSVMIKNKFPVGTPEHMDKMTLKQYLYAISKYCVLSAVEFKGLRMKSDVYDSYISWIPAKMSADGLGQLNNGRITTADKLNMVITEVDWYIISKTYDYDSVEFYNCYVWKKDYMPKELIDCVLHFYEGKTTLKGVKGKELEYQNSKGKLNSCYGMMVQDPLKDESVYEAGKWTVNGIDLNEAIERYNNSPSRFTYYVQGLWITAYCRWTIWQEILAVGEDYVYTDTDSVKMLNPEKYSKWFDDFNKQVEEEVRTAMKHYGFDYSRACPKTIKGVEKLIGVFDFEGVYDKFKTLGAKRYMTLKDGEYELTCSGVVKSAVSYIVEQGGFDAFNMNMTIPADRTGKLTHTYIDTPLREAIMDYQGHTTIVESKTAVHLEPAAYAINPDNEWLDWLFQIK